MSLKSTFKPKAKVCWKIMALSIRDYTFIKVAQAAHHQGDVRCGTSRSVKCSCMSLMLVTWALFISPGI